LESPDQLHHPAEKQIECRFQLSEMCHNLFKVSALIKHKLICTVVFTLSSSGISALDVTSPISFEPTVSGIASVIT